ncbi:ketopantoate reductase family protein [Pseudoalteromonas sp.]|uniref:ketopantoate reductase family protein n=1 Tax=Pseudoalteromonas sp. TaxID=53249 RepID=UPI003565B0F3
MTNILIVGDGAIGLLFSHFLSSQHKVTVLTRKNSKNTRFYSHKNQPSQAINAQFISLEQLPHLAEFDVVLFAVKAFQVADAFAQLKPYLNSRCAIILSHNGMGNVEQLNAELGADQALYFLTTTMAGFKSNHYIVQHTGEGHSILGGCNPLALKNSANMTALLKAIPHLTSTEIIHQLRFKKLLVNIAINPLTALYNIKNGQLRSPIYCTTIMNLLAEACHIAKAQQLDISLVSALNSAYSVMTLTAENYSSMQQDIAHNRTSEIAAICGYISEQGKRYKVKTPYNDMMLMKIEAKKSAV